MDAIPLPRGVDETLALLARGDYVADRALATAVHLALAMQVKRKNNKKEKRLRC